MRPYMCTPQPVQACRWIAADGSTTFNLLALAVTETLSRPNTAICAKVAPSGFQHLVQPHTWLKDTLPLRPTVTGEEVHLQVSVPPAKLGEPGLTPLSTAG